MPTLRPIRRGLSVAALAFAVSAFPVVSSTGPAWAAEPDRILVETLGQMKKFKTQVDAVAPGDRNSANRLKRRMRLFKSRLDSSKTRDAAEYTEATELFDYLNATLDAKAKGEAAPPPPAKKAAAPAAPAADPNKHPDPRIEAALEDMAVIEVAVAELAPGDRDTGNEYLRELKKHRTPIRAASDKEHPRWKQASERYAALDKAIQDQMYAAPAAAAKAPAPAKAAAPAVDPSKHPDQRIEKALAAMAEIEGQVATLQKGDRSTGDALLRELKQQRTPIRAASDKEHPRWKQASEQYAALEQRINDTAYAATAAAAPKAAAPAAAPAVDPSQHPDPRIEAALDAMAGIEGQVANLQKGDRSTGEALMRELKKHRTPIRATSDKAHPRWKQASEQYAALEKRINDTAYASTAPAAKAPAAAAAAPAAGGKHPDARVEEALAAINKLLERAGNLKPGLSGEENEILKLLKKQRLPIRAAADKNHPRWKQASDGYAAVEKAVADNRTKARVAAAEAADAGRDEPVTVEAAQLIDAAERTIKIMSLGDTAAADKVIASLQEADAKLESAKKKEHPLWKEARQRHAPLAERARARAAMDPSVMPTDGLSPKNLNDLEKIRDFVGTMHKEIEAAPANMFMNRENSSVVFYNQQLGQIGQKLLEFPVDHPALGYVAIEIRKAYAALNKRLDAGKAQVAAMDPDKINAQLGDVRTRVPSRNVLPEPLPQDAAPEQIVGFMERGSAMVKQLTEDLQFLASIQGTQFAPRDMGSVESWISKNRENYQRMLDDVTRRVGLEVTTAAKIAEQIPTWDPKNPNHRDNRYLRESGERNRAKLKQGLAQADIAEKAYKAAGDEAKLAALAKDRAAIEQGLATFEKNVVIALGSVRMPKPAKHTDAIVEAAEEVLSNPKYDTVGKVARMVINSPLRRKKTYETEVRGTVTGATAETTIKEWDQFQATTAEETAPGEFHLCYTMIKYFYRGGRNTPTGRWVMSGRHKGPRILEENIDK